MLLAIDTSLREQVVCLAHEGRVVHAVTGEAPRGGLAGRIAALLARAGVDPAGLDAIAVTVGPGSFTGLRTGVATAVGMARGSGCDLVPLPALELAAARAPGERVSVLRDAGRGEVFGAEFDAELHPSEPVPRHGFPQEVVASWRSPTRALIEAAEPQRSTITSALPPHVRVLSEPELVARGDALAARAAARFAARATVGYDELQLLYGQRPAAVERATGSIAKA